VARRHKAAVLLEDSTVRAAALSAAQTLIADRELRAVLLDGGR
jgi:hypothetical protein